MKEHIEELREWLQGRRPGWDIRPAVRALMHEAADAIEAKAAPVGERLVVTVVDPDSRTTTEHVITERDVILLWNRIDTLERELAAYQRAQQPQSAEAVAYTTAGMLAIAKELPLTGRIGARCKADDRWNVPLYTAPQPSAGVVMPTLVVKESGDWGNAYERGFKAALREFARLNGKEVGRG